MLYLPLFLPTFVIHSLCSHWVSKLGYVWKQKQNTIRSDVFNQLFIQYFNDQSAWGDQKAWFELHCFCSLRQPSVLWCGSPTNALILSITLSHGLHVGALKPLAWEAYISREGHWPIHTKEKNKPCTFMISSSQTTILNVIWIWDNHRSPSQIPHVHYNIFNWLARSLTWRMCHEMLNKTLLGEETTLWWQPQVKSCFKWPVSGCKCATP